MNANLNLVGQWRLENSPSGSTYLYTKIYTHIQSTYSCAPPFVVVVYQKRRAKEKGKKKKTRPAKSLQFTSGMENDVYKLSGLPPTPFLSLASSTMARAVLLLPLTPLCRQAFNRQQNVMFPPLFCIFFFKHKNNKSTI